ncbi:MAG: C-terminal binding protein [Candidatus Dormibacteraeota bacterium]|nr:C-terminal binding protein [Candidatus Dormibacteraeota bacterium]
MYRILVTDTDMPSFEIEEEVLRPLGAEIHLASASDEATLTKEAATADGIMVGYAPVTEKVIAAAAEGGCRAMVRYGIGYDNVDIAAAERHGIPVANVPDYCLDEVADHTMALLLVSARKLIDATSSVRAGGWDIPKGQIPRIAGQNLSLVGLGRIGRRVATRALTFGLVVHAYDPVAPVDIPGVKAAGSLEELLADADYVSLHVPMSAATRHIINRKALQAMRRRPVLINTARGGLVDLDAVMEALHAGTLGGVALDVFESEPLPADHPLRTHPAAVITPHMSYYSNDSEPGLIRRVAEEIARGLRGEPLLNPLTKVRVASARSGQPGRVARP